MTDSKPYYDYEASKLNLIASFKRMRESTWSPTPLAKDLKKLAEQLEEVATQLDVKWWGHLEDVVDKPFPIEYDFDGLPIPIEEGNGGKYIGTIARMLDVAKAANQVALELPNSKQRPEIPDTAEIFLHVWYHCENPRPMAYKNDKAVQELKDIYSKGGHELDSESVRIHLSNSIKNFDLHVIIDGLEEILVINQ